MVYKFEIPGMLPTMNKIIASAKKGGSGLDYSSQKKKYTNKVYLSCLNAYKKQGSPVLTSNCSIAIIWYWKDKATDPDNIDAAAKFILDGFQKMGLFPNDNWTYASGARINFYQVDESNPRVLVYIFEASQRFEDDLVTLIKSQYVKI